MITVAVSNLLIFYAVFQAVIELAPCDLGQRAAKTTPSAITQFVYDRSGHLLAESNGATGAAQTEYVWLDDMPLALITGGNVDFIHTDHLGTPQKATDASQNLAWDIVPRPFGQIEQQTFPPLANLRFPGQYFDAEDSLHQNGFRDYDPTIGRYVASDPIAAEDDISSYVYVDDNPVGAVDPTGLSPFKIIKLCAEGYKVLKKVPFKQAVQALRRGENVLAPSGREARKAAKAASDAKSPIRDPAHDDDYMKHYHPNPRTGGHAFYDTLAALSIESHVECNDCIKRKLAQAADFFNPLSAPKDIIDTYDVLTGD
jgi:RHS repeat-associated protein